MIERGTRRDAAAPDTEDITGYPFSTASFAETIALLSCWATGTVNDAPAARSRYFVCANPHSLEIARQDPALHQAILAADLVTPDGAGIVLASRLLGRRIPERVCGPDILPALCDHLNRSHPGTRMFFLGSTDENLHELGNRMRANYPQLVLAGLLSPPYRREFTEEENNAMIEAVNRADADLLWLGLGAPKQEKWTFQYRERLKVKLIGPIGGAFDWYTGRIKLPPLWMQRAGLQWLHRLAQEPRRLWRRNLDSPIFLARVMRQKWAERRRLGDGA